MYIYVVMLVFFSFGLTLGKWCLYLSLYILMPFEKSLDALFFPLFSALIFFFFFFIPPSHHLLVTDGVFVRWMTIGFIGEEANGLCYCAAATMKAPVPYHFVFFF